MKTKMNSVSWGMIATAWSKTGNSSLAGVFARANTPATPSKRSVMNVSMTLRDLWEGSSTWQLNVATSPSFVTPISSRWEGSLMETFSRVVSSSFLIDCMIPWRWRFQGGRRPIPNTRVQENCWIWKERRRTGFGLKGFSVSMISPLLLSIFTVTSEYLSFYSHLIWFALIFRPNISYVTLPRGVCTGSSTVTW